VCDEKNITSGLAENLLVNVQMDGASWQGKTSEKYLDHAHRLETYISNDRVMLDGFSIQHNLIMTLLP
jgi:hypothetical protein